MEIVIVTIITIFSRLLPHVPNATAVGAGAVFSGAKFGIKKAWIITLLTMLVTDVILGLHPVMWATYGSLLLAVCIGKAAATKTTFARAAGAVLASSVLFFILTNFAVWLAPLSMYPKTWTGLAECYVMALPFFRNTLLGDMGYAVVFFGGYAWVKSIQSRMALKKAVASI